MGRERGELKGSQGLAGSEDREEMVSEDGSSETQIAYEFMSFETQIAYAIFFLLDSTSPLNILRRS
jgi:hypothetical protein